MNSKTLLYILRRIGLAVLTMWVVITLAFFVMQAVPGGPFPDETAASPAAQAVMEAGYGQPLHVRYFTYLNDVVTKLDFGLSLKQGGRTVAEILSDGMRISAKLGVAAALCALGTGVALGSAAALRQDHVIDRSITALAAALVSMPSFLLGIPLLAAFARLSGSAGSVGLVLPAVTLALYPAAYITRLTRASMLDVLGQDYIRTAKARGVSGPGIFFGHVLKNALLPVIAWFGPMLAGIAALSPVVEHIFAVPGIGQALVSGINDGDYPVAMGAAIVLASLAVALNLAGIILYQIADPRVHLE